MFGNVHIENEFLGYGPYSVSGMMPGSSSFSQYSQYPQHLQRYL